MTALQHLDAYERKALLSRHLGCLTWAGACAATGLHIGDLPDTIDDATP
jgi:hypothetical protein